MLQESPTICSTDCFCVKQWQNTVAPCHCSLCSHSWLIHCQSHRWSWIQMSTRPHSWMSPRCCQARHASQGGIGWAPSQHSISSCQISSTHCSCEGTHCSHSTTICCSCNNHASCSPKPYSSSPHPVEDTLMCRCKTDRQWCHTSPICWHNQGTTTPYWANVNTTTIMWQDEQAQPRTMDYHQKTLKDNALKAYLPNSLIIYPNHSLTIVHLRLRICTPNFSIWIKLRRGMLCHLAVLYLCPLTRDMASYEVSDCILVQ